MRLEADQNDGLGRVFGSRKYLRDLPFWWLRWARTLWYSQCPSQYLVSPHAAELGQVLKAHHAQFHALEGGFLSLGLFDVLDIVQQRVVSWGKSRSPPCQPRRRSPLGRRAISQSRSSMQSFASRAGTSRRRCARTSSAVEGRTLRGGIRWGTPAGGRRWPEIIGVVAGVGWLQ